MKLALLLCAEDVAAALKPLGYEGLFVPKHKSPCTHLGFPTDGTGVFVLSSRFRLDKIDGVPFVDPASGRPHNQKGAIALCTDKLAAGKRIVLGACHLKAKRGFGDMRTTQLKHMTTVRRAGRSRGGKWLTRFVRCLLRGSRQWPLPRRRLALGCVPSCKATSMTTHPVPSTRLRHQRLTACTGRKAQVRRQGCTRPRARLARAHVCWRFPESEPKFTTWKYRPDADGRPKDSCHVIDYIFHSAGLRPVQLWGIPTAEEIGAGALPCSRYPSDHVSLAAVFRYA